MKIVLVRPPFVNIENGPPIGLAFLSSVLKDESHEVKIMDLNVGLNKKYPGKWQYTRNFILPESHPAVVDAYEKLPEFPLLAGKNRRNPGSVFPANAR